MPPTPQAAAIPSGRCGHFFVDKIRKEAQSCFAFPSWLDGGPPVSPLCSDYTGGCFLFFRRSGKGFESFFEGVGRGEANGVLREPGLFFSGNGVDGVEPGEDSFLESTERVSEGNGLDVRFHEFFEDMCKEEIEESGEVIDGDVDGIFAFFVQSENWGEKMLHVFGEGIEFAG